MEGLPAVVLAYCITLTIPNMAVCGDEDPNSVCTYYGVRLVTVSLHLVDLPRCGPRARGGMVDLSERLELVCAGRGDATVSTEFSQASVFF
jgi:hypothetical protein